MLTLSEALQQVRASNDGSGPRLNLAQLRGLANGLSVEVVGAKPGAVVLLYSGTVGIASVDGQSVSTSALAEAMGEQRKGNC